MKPEPDATHDTTREPYAKPLDYAQADPDPASPFNLYVVSLFGAVALAGVLFAARLIYELLDGK